MRRKISLLFVLFFVSSITIAQKTITMPREGGMSIELQPCITYTILDPGGGGDYPTDCNSTLFLWTRSDKPITINGNYTIGATSNASDTGYYSSASIHIYDGDLLEEENETTHKKLQYPFCDRAVCGQSFVAGTFNASSGTVTGPVSYTSESKYVAIKFQSDATGRADGFSFTVKVGTGNITPPVSDLSVSNIGETSARISWRRIDASSTLKICYGTSPVSATTPTSDISRSNPNYYDLSNLQPGTTYYYKIQKSVQPGNNECDFPMGTFTTIASPNAGDCTNFSNLDDPHVRCFYGNYADPKALMGKVDNGDGIYSRHTVITNRYYDQRATKQGDTLWTIPKGANASVRLGNWQIGSQAENITYQYTVDTNMFDVLLLKYAVVLQNPNHDFVNQPMFTLKVTDVSGRIIDSNCYFVHFVPDSNTQGWHQKPDGLTTIVWKDWTSIGVNLAPLQGQTIFVSLSTHDCNETKHYGYSYFTLSCERKRVEISNCDATIENRFTMPDGFSYKWYKKGSPNTILSRERTYHATAAGTYLCELSFLGDNPSTVCSFTLGAMAAAHYPVSKFSWAEAGNVGCDTRIKLRNQSFVATNEAHTTRALDEGMDYKWYVDGEFVGSDIVDLVLETGQHTVELEASLSNHQCYDRYSEEINIAEGPCQKDEKFICSNKLPYYWRNKPLYLEGTYYDTVHNTNGTDSLFTLFFYVDPSSVEDVYDTICGNVQTSYSTGEVTNLNLYHTDSLKTMYTCDSVIRYYHFINPNTTSLVERSTIENDLPYHYLGVDFYRDVDTTFVLAGQNQYNCDSSVRFVLHVCWNTARMLPQNVCD